MTDEKLPTRQPINATERVGLNYVRSIIERANSIFHEIHRENDYGNDAFMEFVDGDQVTGLSIALQIKSGTSYCSSSTCTIPTTERQWNYWAKSRLPVVGIVYDPDESTAYWVSITRHVKANSAHQSIVFDKSEIARFDDANFREIFLPLFIDRPFRLPFDKSLRFARATSKQMHSIGIRAMFDGHRNDVRTWEAFADVLRSRPAEQIDPILAYILAHIPGHGDISWHSENMLEKHIRSTVRSLMETWGRVEVLQMLRLMDDGGVERGSTGQSVYAVVDLAVKDPSRLLRAILEDNAIEASTRSNALLLLCLREQESVEPILLRFKDHPDLATQASIMLEHLQKVGFFSPS